LRNSRQKKPRSVKDKQGKNLELATDTHAHEKERMDRGVGGKKKGCKGGGEAGLVSYSNFIR